MIRHPLKRFTILTILPVLLGAASVYLHFTQKPPNPFHPSESVAQVASDNNRFAAIYSGIRRHKKDHKKDVVDYVVIERFSAPQEFQVRIHAGRQTSKNHRPDVLELPDRVIDLPAEHQLLQLSDGEFTALKSNVDRECLTEFLATFSPQSTIRELAALAVSKQN